MSLFDLIANGIPAIGAITAAIAVLRWGIPGFFLGVLAFSVSILLMVEMLGVHFPERNAKMHDLFAILMAPSVASAWCLAFLIGRAVYRRQHARRLPNRPEEKLPAPPAQGDR